MTIKKTIATSLVAASLITTAALAGDLGGEITVLGGGTISEERLAVADLNISLGNFQFIPNFNNPAVRDNPVFEFTFTPAVADLATDLVGSEVYEVNATGFAETAVSDGFTVTGNTVSFT
ncbi:MAG: hypothetical protein U9R50_01445, partial [Campylobacterota bacterium]|nr:hypothetical protein [Campylobacterota bacterium]